MIKTVLFDLDETIYNFKMAERIAVSKTLRELGVEPTDYVVSQYSKYNQSQWKRLELGEITRQQVKENRYQLLFDELGVDISPKLATTIYEKNLAQGHYFIDGAEEMLKSIYKDYDLYLVSNGSKNVQDGRLASSGIAKYFKGIFISEVVGFDKPNIEFFNICFNSIPNLEKEKTVIIGDSLSSDIKGGNNAGIKTMWFNPNNSDNTTNLRIDLEIHSLSEIKNALKML